MMDRDETGMRISRRGEIWFAYDEQAQLRLYVILSDRDINVAEIDPGKEARSKSDVVIEQWKDAGLSEPSVVRCSRIFTIHENLFGFKVGELSDGDFESVLRTLQECFS